MTKKELRDRIDFHPRKVERKEKIEYSSKLTPYVDNERSFTGYTRCTSNVLAEKNNDTALAMCKDAK